MFYQTEELTERRARETRRQAQLAEARRKADQARSAGASPAREVAPVVVYVDGRSARETARIATVLGGRNIPWQERDVEHDESSRSWVLARSRAEKLPVVFVAGEPLGAYDRLVQLDVNGDLERMVFPDGRPAGSPGPN